MVWPGFSARSAARAGSPPQPPLPLPSLLPPSSLLAPLRRACAAAPPLLLGRRTSPYFKS